MARKKDLSKIPSNTSKNFEELSRAFGHGRVALVRAVRKSDGEPVTLVCAISDAEDGEVIMSPFAVMLAEDGNPYEQFAPAGDPEFDELINLKEKKGKK